ncbi:MAG: hypothetical protein N2170_07200 [Bacteroidia bacterium]|nr:hypothetical protein [Bacteroidia bacterium]
MISLCLWAQSCCLPYSLSYQDSLWQETPRSFRALAAQRKKLDLREKRSGLRIPPTFFSLSPQLSLLRLCSRDTIWEWHIQSAGDTFVMISHPPPSRWLQRHFHLLRGPRTWYPGSPPFKEIEILVPLSRRPQTPQDTLWLQNSLWLDSLALPWTLIDPPSRGKLSAIGLTIRYDIQKRIRYHSLSLYLHCHPNLPFDEKIREKPLSALPKEIRKRLLLLLQKAPPYAYPIRIQDYYPATLTEAWSWMNLLLQKKDLPRPDQLDLSLVFPPQGLP